MEGRQWENKEEGICSQFTLPFPFLYFILFYSIPCCSCRSEVKGHQPGKENKGVVKTLKNIQDIKTC